MLTVVCSKWGVAYGPEYVNRLARMVARYLTVPYRFFCFTDDPSGVKCRTMDLNRYLEGKPREQLFTFQGNSGISMGWPNLYLFRTDFPFRGRILYLDLDVVITGSLDDLVRMPGDFIAIKDWWAKNWNGSVNLFEAGAFPAIWDDFPPPNVGLYGNGQDWLAQHVPDGTAWPDAWVKSYKIHAQDGIPPDCRVVVFHGQPKPVACQGWVTDYWK